MALNRVAQDMISHGAQVADQLRELIGMLDELNILYDSGGGYKSTIIQDDLDEIVSLAGLTKDQLDDGMYVLTSTIRGALHDGFSQLVQLAARK